MVSVYFNEMNVLYSSIMFFYLIIRIFRGFYGTKLYYIFYESVINLFSKTTLGRLLLK